MKRSQGFTLVELVLIIIVLAVLSVVVFIQSSDFYTIKLNSAARKLASDMRFAQQMSITKQNKHGVVFNIPIANKYTVYELDDPLDPARDPAGGKDFIVDYTTGEFIDITITSTLPVDGSGRQLVKFDSQGVPLRADNNNPLPAGSNTVTLTYQGTKVITIEPNTGRVTYP